MYIYPLTLDEYTPHQKTGQPSFYIQFIHRIIVTIYNIYGIYGSYNKKLYK